MSKEEKQSQSKTDDTQKGYSYEADISKMPEVSLTGHSWRQRGTLLVCISCQMEHAHSPMDIRGRLILANHQYRGLDAEGKPIFEKL